MALISSAAAGTLPGCQGGTGLRSSTIRGDYRRGGLLLPNSRRIPELPTELSAVPIPVLVLSDFNAKNMAWGTRYRDTWGSLSILNRGSTPRVCGCGVCRW